MMRVQNDSVGAGTELWLWNVIGRDLMFNVTGHSVWCAGWSICIAIPATLQVCFWPCMMTFGCRHSALFIPAKGLMLLSVLGEQAHVRAKGDLFVGVKCRFNVCENSMVGTMLGGTRLLNVKGPQSCKLFWSTDPGSQKT